jgi:hypothetical protein
MLASQHMCGISPASMTPVLPQGDARQARVQRVNYLADTLEQGYIPAQTIPFFNLVNGGDWVHLFNSWNLRRKATDEVS